MSAFTETAFLKKLGELNNSQQSIQTLSLWLIHHRKHHELIVKTWLRELETVPEGRKLTFMYLANDVIQNSKKKGPEYGKEFGKQLSHAFSHIGKSCKSERLIGSLGRMLCIWEERGVYDGKIIEEYRSRLNGEHKNAAGDTTAAAGSAASNGSNGDGGASVKLEQKAAAAAAATSKNSKITDSQHEKRKHDGDNSRSDSKRKNREDGKHHHKYDEKSKDAAKRKHKSPGGGGGNSERQHSTPENGDGSGDISPYVPLGDPPEPEDLIKALISIENSASSDVVVRERIAKLPPEISEMSCLSKLEDKEAAKALSKQVNEAVDLLNEYNARLSAEMDERSKLAAMLRDFQAEQKELLAQAEKSLEEHKKKLNKVTAVQREIRDHLSNLPDMTQLPDVTELAPLPSAGDLFNIH